MDRPDIVAIKKRLRATTPGPWFAAYSAIWSIPLQQEYDRLEQLIPDDAPDEDPRWKELPEARLAYLPTVAGDTPTIQGARDAEFIAESKSDIKNLINYIEWLEK